MNRIVVDEDEARKSTGTPTEGKKSPIEQSGAASPQRSIAATLLICSHGRQAAAPTRCSVAGEVRPHDPSGAG
jgi:hypothetical protein